MVEQGLEATVPPDLRFSVLPGRFPGPPTQLVAVAAEAGTRSVPDHALCPDHAGASVPDHALRPDHAGASVRISLSLGWHRAPPTFPPALGSNPPSPRVFLNSIYKGPAPQPCQSLSPIFPALFFLSAIIFSGWTSAPNPRPWRPVAQLPLPLGCLKLRQPRPGGSSAPAPALPGPRSVRSSSFQLMATLFFLSLRARSQGHLHVSFHHSSRPTCRQTLFFTCSTDPGPPASQPQPAASCASHPDDCNHLLTSLPASALVSSIYFHTAARDPLKRAVRSGHPSAHNPPAGPCVTPGGRHGPQQASRDCDRWAPAPLWPVSWVIGVSDCDSHQKKQRISRSRPRGLGCRVCYLSFSSRNADPAHGRDPLNADRWMSVPVAGTMTPGAPPITHHLPYPKAEGLRGPLAARYTSTPTAFPVVLFALPCSSSIL